MPPALQWLGVAGATSFVLNTYAPGYTIAASYFWTGAVLFLLQFTAWTVYQVIIYPRFFSPLRHLPMPPEKDNSFFMGHSKRIGDEPSGHPMLDWIESVPNDGIIYYRHWFNRERVLLTNPTTLGEVLVTKNYEFVKPSFLRTSLGRILGVGILLAEGDEHKRQRKLLMPAFAFRHVKDLYPVFWSKSRELIECLSTVIKSLSADGERASNVIEIGQWTSRATLDIIAVAGMGQDFGALQDPSNKLYQTYQKVFNPGPGARVLQFAGALLPFWLLRNLPIKRNKEILEANTTIKQVCRDLIAAKRRHMEKNERTEVDILSVALESGGFSDEDLVNQMMTFLIAGHETTATAMIWAAYLLCKHPNVQKRLREEITAKLPSILDKDFKITSIDIDSLPYLHAVCNEILRVWAPVSLTLRVAANDSSINGHFIPKGTQVMLVPFAINQSKELWGDDAREFKPERWLAEGQANKGGADSNYSFMTFLHGPRSCIGQAFSKAEFACLLAAVVGHFDMEFENGDFEPEIKGGITAKPKGGLWIRLTENQSW